MRCVVCSIIGLICFGLFSVSADATEKAFWPFGQARFSPETPEPINIVSGKAKKIATTPLKLVIGITETVRLINTGYSVEVIITSRFTSTIAYGGVLGKNVYIVSRIKFIFNNETGGIAGTTVNGKHGEQIEVAVYYYKKMYGSFENALNYRDGLFEIRIRVRVGGNVSHALLDLLEYYLKKIKNPGSSVEISIIPVTLFSIKNPVNIQYFAYPGCFTNETTGKQYYSTITILKQRLPDVYITKKQFEETFGSMLNYEKQPLDTASPTLAAGDRPIVSARGIVEIATIFSVLRSKPGGI